MLFLLYGPWSSFSFILPRHCCLFLVSYPGLSLVMTGISANDVVSFFRLVTSCQASLFAAALFALSFVLESMRSLP